MLSPRGKVLERGMPRFSGAEGVFDLEDLRFHTQKLADFIVAAAAQYGFNPGRVVAVGFSNGANIAASVLLLRPETLGDTVLFRAMVPLVPEPLPKIPGTPVLLSNGRLGSLVSRTETERGGAAQRGRRQREPCVATGRARTLTDGDIDTARQGLSSAVTVGKGTTP
jgi:predicted esterase